jgi:cyclic peptide transporter
MPEQKITAKAYSGFLQMILKNGDTPVRTLIVYTIISGIANAVILSVFNSAANSAGEGSVNLKYLLMFGVALLVFFITKKYILKRSVQIVENSIYNIRLRVLGKLRACELSSMESIGKGEIFTRISHDANFISQSAAVIVNAFQALVLVLFTLFYIALLSIWAFGITIGVLYIAIAYYMRRQKEINKELHEATQNETELYEHIENLIDGFKELKISGNKNTEFFNDLTLTAAEGKKLKISSGLRFAVGFMFSEMVFYMLLASIVFVLPQFDTMFAGDLTRITAAILFIIGPLENIVTTIPLFIKANVATQNILGLEEKIEHAKVTEETTVHVPITPLEEINLENVTYQYLDEEKQSTFMLGPINFKIKKGELLCIVGGNGSGKSTFLKVLTSLYSADSGLITYNGKPIKNIGLQQFRSQFSVIFTDFHLFPKIYGIQGVDKEKVMEYIRLMKLENKTTFDGENFTNVKLSTGQRKRLALICTLLEDKPFMILDEVTADQDPEFKRFFYQEVLPGLKEKGKTVIMVSHDDKYFEQFDRVIKMEYGKILSQ